MSKGTNTIGYQPNWDNIENLIDEGYINKKEHPDNKDISIYCYTNACQYDSKWTKDTLICRGLITKNGRVISRPFPKFFNYQEFSKSQANILKGEWDVYEKLDGSLGVLYEFDNNDYRIATKGSFDSPQAVWATNYLKEHYPDLKLKPNITYLFEIIYPENRIVVDYSGLEGIFLLDTLNSINGERVLNEFEHDFQMVEQYDSTSTFNLDERSNKEGYVLVNKKGFRIKVKHEEYVELHKLKDSLSNTLIWEALKSGKGIQDIIDNTGDEFYDWIADTEEQLIKEYLGLIKEYTTYLALKPDTECRKTIAQYFTQYEYSFILFAWLDKKNIDDKIWDVIKPERKVAVSNFKLGL